VPCWTGKAFQAEAAWRERRSTIGGRARRPRSPRAALDGQRAIAAAPPIDAKRKQEGMVAKQVTMYTTTW
jgi:hypothetical protein